MNNTQVELLNRLVQIDPSFDLSSLLTREIERLERLNSLPVKFLESLASSSPPHMKITISMKQYDKDVHFSLSIHDFISSSSLNKILNTLYPLGVVVERSGFSYNIASISGVLRSLTLEEIQRSLPALSTEKKTIHTGGIDSNKILSLQIQKF